MNAAAHRWTIAIALGAAGALFARRPEDQPAHVLAGCAGGFYFGTLPDLIEPATHPHHRQFFHSAFVAVAIGYGLYRLYRWELDTPMTQTLRALALVAGGAYLVHLAMDATTKRSLPLIGRLA
jgi:inner membrane protein